MGKREDRQKARQLILETATKQGLGKTQLFGLRLALFARRNTDDVDDLCDAILEAQGAGGDINWDAISKFIQEVLPVILEFIKQLVPLFAV